MKKTKKILSFLAILALFMAFGLSSCTKTELETFDDIESIDTDKSSTTFIEFNSDGRNDHIDIDDDVTDDEDDDDEEEEERKD